MYKLLALVSCTFVVVGSAGCAPGSNGKSRISQAVGASGGTVSNGGASVTLPAGAVSGNVTITNTQDPNAPQPTEGTVLGTPYTFGPEGQQFSVPVTVTLPFDPTKLPAGASTSDIVIVTAPAGSTDFVSIGGMLVDSTHIAAMTTHFSTFLPIILPHSDAGTSSGSGGGGPDGGASGGHGDGGPTMSGGGPDAGAVMTGSDGGSGAGGTELCTEVINCIGSCGLSSQCQEMCYPQGTAQAQELAAAVVNCVLQYCPAGDGGVCETSTSGCQTCEQTNAQDNCSGPYDACVAASDGGVNQTRDGGSMMSGGNDGGGPTPHDAGTGCGPGTGAGGPGVCDFSMTCGSTLYEIDCSLDAGSCACLSNSMDAGMVPAPSTVCNGGLPPQWTECGFPGGPAIPDAGSAGVADAG